jgi:hypothetical protein
MSIAFFYKPKHGRNYHRGNGGSRLLRSERPMRTARLVTLKMREWTAQPGKQKLFAVLDWKGKTVRSRIGSRVGDKIIALQDGVRP